MDRKAKGQKSCPFLKEVDSVWSYYCLLLTLYLCMVD